MSGWMEQGGNPLDSNATGIDPPYDMVCVCGVQTPKVSFDNHHQLQERSSSIPSTQISAEEKTFPSRVFFKI